MRGGGRNARDGTAAGRRLGFDRGWLRLGPTFLGLDLSCLLVDRRWVGDDGDLSGLEPFGDRNPRLPFPAVSAVADLWGRHSIRLVQDRGRLGTGAGLADASFAREHSDAWWSAAHGAGVLVVFVGDTYRVELRWATLWDCTVGAVRVLPVVPAAEPPRFRGSSWWWGGQGEAA